MTTQRKGSTFTIRGFYLFLLLALLRQRVLYVELPHRAAGADFFGRNNGRRFRAGRQKNRF